MLVYNINIKTTIAIAIPITIMINTGFQPDYKLDCEQDDDANSIINNSRGSW
jgi:hypothetical protein